MKKLIFSIICTLFVFWVLSFVDENNNLISIQQANAATTGSVTLTGTVLQYLALTFTSGSTISFGNITPGTPSCNGSGTVASVTTNAANGYTLGLSDADGANSSMTHTDATTHIADMAGTFGAPALWVDGTTTGVGVTLFAASTNKEALWGTGTTACDSNNKWAGVPAAATTGHTVTGYHAGADTSSWGWKVDVPNNQKTGIYSGTVLFTSAATLS